MSQAEKDYLDSYLKGLRERTAPDMPEDEFFERFCGDQILKNRDLDVTELASGVVRGKHDGGIDSVYLFANGRLIQEGADPDEFSKQQDIKLHLVVIQATRTPHFDEEMIRKFSTVADHLLDAKNSPQDYEDRYNTDLRKAFQRFQYWWSVLIPQLPSLTITFYCASKAMNDANTNVKTLAQELEEKLRRMYHCECSVEFVNAKGLIELAKKSRRKPLVLRFTEHLSSGNMGPAYICLVPIRSYVEFLTDEDGQRREYILAPNVRAYLGDKGINQQIRETLEGPQEMEFWWLNNGVTIVASKIRPSTRELTLEEPRIVNGLQTSREIYEYSRTKNVESDPRHVAVRVMETSDWHVFSRILKTTNNQTRIAKVYFHSMEDIHEKIEMAFPVFGLFYERTKNQYFDESHERNKIITLPYLIQALIAVLLQSPDQARGRPASFGEKNYGKLFRDRDKPRLYANVALLMKRVESFLHSHTGFERNHQYNIKFYVALYAAVTLLGEAEPMRSKFEQMDVSNATDELLAKCVERVDEKYQKLIVEIDSDGDKVAKGTLLTDRIRADLKKRFGRRERRAKKKVRKA